MPVSRRSPPNFESLRAYILGTEEASASLVHNVQKTWLGLLMRFQLRPTNYGQLLCKRLTAGNNFTWSAVRLRYCPPNTKMITSRMSRWKPTRERLSGLHCRRVCIGSSSRGIQWRTISKVGPVGVWKVSLAVRVAEGQKLDAGIGNSVQAI